MEWYLKAFRHYADFSGRASRQEFLMFLSCAMGIGNIFLILDCVLIGSVGWTGLVSLYGAVHLCPFLSVMTRRLHDADRSGYLLLLGLFPVVGWAILFAFLLLNGTPGGNRYGVAPSPFPVPSLARR